ncbi:hypothetical protein N7456_003720 [Penicillium angulare]|uniref:Xylanolytic transcriptional activator regulatory domain-containing protein n=1 Tax=Penicillium angulare TaxID=116970 RepID=A0A9W9FW04_9EURO|nr:hypothetical protein N7456_003720 [Penicillium angulare]
MAMDMVENPASMGLDFDPSIFDQSMLSTVNWLPNEYFADPASEQGQSSGGPSQFSQQFPDNYTNRMSWHPPVIHANPMGISAPENFPQTPSGNISMGTDMGSPRRYSHVHSEASPLSGSVDSTKRSADYYVDGGGARLPKYRKKQTLWSTSSIDMASTNGSHRESNSRRFDFPSTHEIIMEELPDEATYSAPLIDSTTYNEICRNFLLLCRTDNPFFETFKSDNFPTAEDCNRYIVCYFDTFHAVYPVLHLPSFNPNSCYWLLAVAVIAIGCHGVNHSAADQLQAAFHEMIQRALHIEVFYIKFCLIMSNTNTVSRKKKIFLVKIPLN